MKLFKNISSFTLLGCLLFASCDFHKDVSITSNGVPIYSDTVKNRDSIKALPTFIYLDSLKINNSNITYSAGRFYYRTGDSLNWITDTTTLHWRRNAKGVKATNIWYLIPVNVSPLLINIPLCFSVHFEAFEFYLNGKLLNGNGKVSANDKYEKISRDEKYFYFSFSKTHNYIILRTSNPSKIGDYSDSEFTFRSDNKEKSILKANFISDAIRVGLSIFFFAFFFIYFLLYISDKRVKVNLFFSLFCLLICVIFMLKTTFLDTDDPYLGQLQFTAMLIDIAFLFYMFIAFLQQLVFGNLKRYLRWFLLVCILTCIGAILGVGLWQNEIVATCCIVAVLLIAVFATIDGIRVVIIGLKNKIRGIKPIIFGIFLSMLLSIVSFIIVFIPSTRHFSFLSWAISLSVIPLSVAITLVNNYTKTGKLLALELNHVKELSARTIRQEKEKQDILESQKEKLEEQVNIRTAEIVQQKNEITLQKELVELKNKDILDSITYAKRLQDAILPPVSIIQMYFPDSFVLYKPKDIVAGDFYWMERLGNLILLAACDCTGHGVPGALVSVVCSNALNRTVKEFKITKPGEILDKVRELVLETFSRKDSMGDKSGSEVKDGMDVSLCCINSTTNEIQWSGAYNPLWYLHGEVFHEIKGDKQPIGSYDISLPFNTHNVFLNKGDCLYLFTDGYADQFGGIKGKKFKYKQLQELLVTHSAEPMDVQKKVLLQKLEEWMGALEQVDDILLIGIRI